MAESEWGDAIKALEMMEAGRKAMPRLPLLARLDGRAFHTYTRGMQRPFDPLLSACMADTMRSLVGEFHAVLGYTQSDEITLAWREPCAFDGRWQKLTSVLAGFASAVFARLALTAFPGRGVPCFDCRAWQVPTLDDVIDVFLWREADAVKNSVQMAAQSIASHRTLHGKSRHEQMEILHAAGINWNDYPVHFKRGVYAQRRVVERTLTADERERIPEKHRPSAESVFLRGVVEILDLPPLQRGPEALALLAPRPTAGEIAESAADATVPPPADLLKSASTDSDPTEASARAKGARP